MNDGNRDVIPRSIKLVAGRTRQEYSQRKGRRGAFLEDRNHATAVKTDRHFLQCLVYIDLNMVSAGVIAHPMEWIFSGYCEIQESRVPYPANMDLENGDIAYISRVPKIIF